MIKSSDFNGIEKQRENKGFIEWVKSISKFISEDDVLLKKLQDDLLLPLTNSVVNIRSQLNKGRINEYYQNQGSVVINFLKGDVDKKDFDFVIEYLWEVFDCAFSAEDEWYLPNDSFTIAEKYYQLISQKNIDIFRKIVVEVRNGFLEYFDKDKFNPLVYLTGWGKGKSDVKENLFNFHSYIIFDKNQNKFFVQNNKSIVSGQNLPSTLVLSNPIKPKHEGDSLNINSSKENGVLLDNDEFVVIGKKEMLGYIDKFFTNLIQNKRTFKPGQLPIVTQNNLSIWKILFNDRDYVNYRKQYFIACFNLMFERISENEFLELLVPLVKNSVSSYSVATLGDDWKENKSISDDLPYGMFGEESKGERFNCQDELYCLAC